MFSSLLILVFILAFSLTWFLHSYATKKQLLDLPNHRSSHSIPTPRGGGLAFVIIYLLMVLFLKIINNSISMHSALILTIPGLLIALIGWLDDRNILAVYWRLLGHFCASILVVYLFGAMLPKVMFLGHSLPLVLVNILVILYLVWLLNLYNFMDGINGLAAVEAISVCVGMSFIYAWHNEGYLAHLPMILSFAVGGFLVWNFPTARIFMGDSGSSFLGFSLGVLSLLSAEHHIQYFCSWLILLGVFIVDATFTLLYRLIKGYKVYEAHRSHAYQHAAIYFDSHSVVTLGILAINIVWLFPWSVLVGLGKVNCYTGIICAYVPLFVLLFVFDAGKINKATS
jgi:Fuc2NAc and GlcNAc transferase